MSFFFTAIGYLSFVLMGFAALGVVFDFPLVECLLLLMGSTVLNVAALSALNALEEYND